MNDEAYLRPVGRQGPADSRTDTLRPTRTMGWCNFGASGTIVVVTLAPPMTKTGRGIDGCAMASDRG